MDWGKIECRQDGLSEEPVITEPKWQVRTLTSKVWAPDHHPSFSITRDQVGNALGASYHRSKDSETLRAKFKKQNKAKHVLFTLIVDVRGN